jgi:hypothetical protein
VGTIFPKYFVSFTIFLLYIRCNNLFTHRSCTRPILKNEYVSMHIQIDTLKVFMRIFVGGGDKFVMRRCITDIFETNSSYKKNNEFYFISKRHA